jgi:hypothetical protein
MPNLGPGESLTSGGYVRRADGVVVITPQAKALLDNFRALGSPAGKTMAEIATVVGNCDPIPAGSFTNGYAHSWSEPGYTVSVLFGHDNRAIGILNNSEVLGGPPTPGLAARQAAAPPTKGQRFNNWVSAGAYGEIHAQVVCPHCQRQGAVRIKRMKQKKGISGGKATGAVLTGGLSILATGLSRKGWVTQAHCDACNTTWNL